MREDTAVLYTSFRRRSVHYNTSIHTTSTLLCSGNDENSKIPIIVLVVYLGVLILRAIASLEVRTGAIVNSVAMDRDSALHHIQHDWNNTNKIE